MCTYVWQVLQAAKEAAKVWQEMNNMNNNSTSSPHVHKPKPKRDHACILEELLCKWDIIAATYVDVPRFRDIGKIMHDFNDHLVLFRPTRMAAKPLHIDGFKYEQQLTAYDKACIKHLCKNNEIAPIAPPTARMLKMVKEYHHYTVRNDGNIVSYLCLAVYYLNNSPNSVCVSVECAVAEDNKHSMTTAIQSIIRHLRRLTGRCVLFTQGSFHASETFWKRKLPLGKRASMMNGLITTFNKHHKIFVDTVDHAIFLD